MKGLTKENFFNPLMEKYPKAVQAFCDWIDGYKLAVDWRGMFREIPTAGWVHPQPVKFHDLPFEMQSGVIERFFDEKNLLMVISAEVYDDGINWLWQIESQVSVSPTGLYGGNGEYHTRSEAQQAAYEKAFEILNEKLQ